MVLVYVTGTDLQDSACKRYNTEQQNILNLLSV